MSHSSSAVNVLTPPSFQAGVPHCIAETIRWHFDSFTRGIEALREQRFGGLELCEITGNAQTILARFYRLASHPDMRRVWKRLSEATPKSGSIESFLTSYARIASYPGEPVAFWNSVPSLKEQRERLDEIADLAKVLSQKLGPVIPFPTVHHTAWNSLSVGVEALNRDAKLRDENKKLHQKLLWLQKRNPDLQVGNGGHTELPWIIGPQAVLSGLDKELPALKELALLSKKYLAKSPKGGTKRYARIIIARLAGWVDHCLTGPHNQEIATTVTVALNLPMPVDEAYVRQVRKPSSRKKPSRNP